MGFHVSLGECKPQNGCCGYLLPARTGPHTWPEVLVSLFRCKVGLGFRVEGLEFGLGFRTWGLGFAFKMNRSGKVFRFCMKCPQNLAGNQTQGGLSFDRLGCLPVGTVP